MTQPSETIAGDFFDLRQAAATLRERMRNIRRNDKHAGKFLSDLENNCVTASGFMVADEIDNYLKPENS